MGQYYRPIILSDEGKITKHFYSHNYDNGLKLMEHSYLHNNFVNAVINTAIAMRKPVRIVWAGDYAEKEENSEDNLYALTENFKDLEVTDADQTFNSSLRYLINEDKKEFVDLWDIPSFDGRTIHPLPILTSDGNGQGGGDYYGCGMNFVGTWARDHITFKEWKSWQDDVAVEQNYKNIRPDFTELWMIEETLKRAYEILGKGINEGTFAVGDVKEIFNNLKEKSPEFITTYKK